MADLSDLINRLPINDLAAQVGADPQDVLAAAQQAVPTLVAGLAAQTESPDSTAKLETALSAHAADLAEGDIDLGQVDSTDGSKIVGKLFGGESDNVALGISNAVPAAAVDPGLVKKLLPMLAPIVLSYVVSQMGGKKGSASAGGGLGDLLGGMLGGGNTGGLGDILGSVLGGGGGKGGNPLGSILGSILGGK